MSCFFRGVEFSHGAAKSSTDETSTADDGKAPRTVEMAFRDSAGAFRGVVVDGTHPPPGNSLRRLLGPHQPDADGSTHESKLVAQRGRSQPQRAAVYLPRAR